MTHEIDCEQFRSVLNAHCPDKPVTEVEAAESYRNLGEFINLLVHINEREKIVPFDQAVETKQG